MHAVIRKLGYHLILAEDEIVAVKYCENKRIDDLFMGIGMPALDGFETAENREKCLSNGFDVYLSKPIELKVVVETIKKSNCFGS